jgi:hypothetical protein
MLEKGKLSALQMAIIMKPTITATAVLLVPAITARHARQDLWISPIWASVAGLLAVFVACGLNKFYPKESLVEFCGRIVGRWPGKILGLVYLLFYLHLCSIIVRLRNEIDRAVRTIEPENAEGHVSISLLQARSKLIPKIEDGKWKITLKATSEDDIVQNGTRLDLMNPQVIRELEQQLNEETEDKVNAALEQVQKGMKADIFGFAEAFHRAYPHTWKKIRSGGQCH